MSLKVNLMESFLQLIIALTIVRNGCPRITGVLKPWIGHKLCLKNNKIDGVDKLPDLDKDISKIFSWKLLLTSQPIGW